MTNEHWAVPQEKAAPADHEPTVTAKPPFVPPLLTKHGPVVAVTQKNRYAPFFQEMIVAETSP